MATGVGVSLLRDVPLGHSGLSRGNPYPHTHKHSHQVLQVQTLSPQVLTALHYMHTDLRALHRDVKAANVLLTKAGKVKLGDLGVAAQVGRPTLTHRDNRKSR